MVCIAQRSQRYTRLANIRGGPATNFAAAEPPRPQKEQRIVFRSLCTSHTSLKYPPTYERSVANDIKLVKGLEHPHELGGRLQAGHLRGNV
jgi:hypothetical protein